jgi:hypothetical protein
MSRTDIAADTWTRHYQSISPGRIGPACFPRAGGTAGFRAPASRASRGAAGVPAERYPGRRERRRDGAGLTAGPRTRTRTGAGAGGTLFGDGEPPRSAGGAEHGVRRAAGPYRAGPGAGAGCPVAAPAGGRGPRVPAADAQRRAEDTAGRFSPQVLPGGRLRPGEPAPAAAARVRGTLTPRQ